MSHEFRTSWCNRPLPDVSVRCKADAAAVTDALAATIRVVRGGRLEAGHVHVEAPVRVLVVFVFVFVRVVDDSFSCLDRD